METKKLQAPKVFSYIRFSTPEQAMGDSERRQLAEAEDFARRKGLKLDDSLRMTDRGLSGFRGEHRKRGALRAFLENVESGQVPAGSILLVENLDRLGREGVVEALSEVILAIIKKDVSIQTVNPSDTYSRESINSGGIWRLIAHIERAHDESQRKSHRLGAAWANKRNRIVNGEILTGRIPAWLKIENGKLIAIPEAAKTIRSIFKMKLAGLGRQAIEKKLNASAAWTPPANPKRKGQGWRASYITKILNNRAAIGEFQPFKGSHKYGTRMPFGEPIADYYPAIVNPDDFYAVQKQLAANKGKGGETGKATNLFTHIVRCAYCGGSMVFIDKGSSSKGGSYLVCDNGRRGVRDDSGKPICKSHSIPYHEAEAAVLENCINLRPEQILPSPDDQAAQISNLQDRLAGLRGKSDDSEKRISSLLDGLERATSKVVRDRLTARIDELEQEKKAVALELEAAEAALESAKSSRTSAQQWKRDLKELRSALATKGQVETRLRLRAHLRELIQRIEVFAVGFTKKKEAKPAKRGRSVVTRRRGEKRHLSSPTVTPAVTDDGEDLANHFYEIASELEPKQARTEEFHEFCEWVTSRRMSKAGRFLRIHFKTGLRRDIVPGDSIASGRGMEVDQNGSVGWGVKQPEFKELWKRFRSAKRHEVRPTTT